VEEQCKPRGSKRVAVTQYKRAVLLQEGKPVIYVSRALTPAEERYSNIERELLGVVFVMERLHNYVFGGPELKKTTNL